MADSILQNGFRTIAGDHPISFKAVSLLPEYLSMPDVKPQWMSGDGVRREWLCPIYGISAEMELIDFLYFLVRLLKPELVVECGSHVGLSSYALGRAVQDNRHGEVITSDINAEYVRRAKDRCTGLPVDVRHCSSFELPIEDADFLFIDFGDPCSPQPDIARLEALKMAKPGALVTVHDTRHEPHLGEEIEKTEKQFINFRTWRGFSLIQK